jgi:hypothetical protein
VFTVSDNGLEREGGISTRATCDGQLRIIVNGGQEKTSSMIPTLARGRYPSQPGAPWTSMSYSCCDDVRDHACDDTPIGSRNELRAQLRGIVESDPIARSKKGRSPP